jgi:hypothetical protein
MECSHVNVVHGLIVHIAIRCVAFLLIQQPREQDEEQR